MSQEKKQERWPESILIGVWLEFDAWMWPKQLWISWDEIDAKLF